MKGAMLERDIQARVVAYARKCGVIARKLDFGQGWPDYLLLFAGEVMFVEFKSDTGQLSLLQRHVAKILVDHGFKFRICRDVESGIRLVDQLVNLT
jgi:hypothetical protein